MSRKRVIDAEELYFDEELVEALGERGLHLYILLWSLAEDWGGFIPDCAKIAFKMGTLKFNGAEVRECLQKLINLKKIIPYQAHHPKFGIVEAHWLKNLMRHQENSYPGLPKIPLPPWITFKACRFPSGKQYAVYQINPEKLPEYLHKTTWKYPGDSGSVPVTTRSLPQETAVLETETNTNKECFLTKTLSSEQALPEGEDKDQKPDSLPEKTKKAKKERKITAKQIVDLWNEIDPIPGMEPVELFDERKRKVDARITFRDDLEYWRKIFLMVKGNPFLRGENGTWRATLDWIMKNNTNGTKIYEGHYERGNGQTGANFQGRNGRIGEGGPGDGKFSHRSDRTTVEVGD